SLPRSRVAPARALAFRAPQLPNGAIAWLRWRVDAAELNSADKVHHTFSAPELPEDSSEGLRSYCLPPPLAASDLLNQSGLRNMSRPGSAITPSLNSADFSRI